MTNLIDIIDIDIYIGICIYMDIDIYIYLYSYIYVYISSSESGVQGFLRSWYTIVTLMCAPHSTSRNLTT